ncbi:MAG: lysophospholipid acyltransferase [Gaeavirus sp.]|uniref:Lysophospholipid acyltransferase n=1 Tax=Gaeavirus sp. TaxID=2487767 RepID=A0A3G4ZZL0_9VIRU|nr:MAG: lysophospholipid acyltransferase [Gaeavirus sp.]
MSSNKSPKILSKSIESKIVINSRCHCKKYFMNTENIRLIYPCSHFMHDQCINDLLTSNIKLKRKHDLIKCPICQADISMILTEDQIQNNKKYLQYKTDLNSIKLTPTGSINPLRLPYGILNFTGFMNKLILAQSKTDIINVIDCLLKTLNVKINVIDNTQNSPIEYKNNTICWKNKSDSDSKIVLLPNHTSYLDSPVLLHLFKCGFIANEFITTTQIGSIFAAKCNLLIFDQNKDTNVVNKIKEYLNTHKIITIFPEGTIGSNHTLLRFRTGAFYTDANICPIVIKYRPHIWDDDIKTIIFKLTSQPEINVDIIINDLVHPPFDDNKINNVRNFMAEIGELKLSRVSTKFCNNI